MNATLSPADRQRLTAILGMLGSQHAGERDAAGLAAQRFIRDRGLAWQDVLQPSTALAVNRNTSQPWRVTAAGCLRQPGSLGEWDRNFLTSLLNFVRISPKQQSVLDKIADRVLRRTAA